MPSPILEVTKWMMIHPPRGWRVTNAIHRHGQGVSILLVREIKKPAKKLVKAKRKSR